MTTLTLVPTGKSARSRFQPSERRPEMLFGGTGYSVLRWDVRPKDDLDVHVETRNDFSKVVGQVRVFVGDKPEGQCQYGDDPIVRGRLQYFFADKDVFPRDTFEAAICVSHENFVRLGDLIERGYLPTVDVILAGSGERPNAASDNLRDLVPDGMGSKWNNKEHRYLPIHWVEFEVRPLVVNTPVVGEESGEAKEIERGPVRQADVRELGAQLARCEALLSRFRQQLVPAAWILVLFVAYLIIKGR